MEQRTPTAVDVLAEDYLDDLVRLDPALGTYLGVGEQQDRLPDMSPDGRAAVSDLRRRTLTAAASATPVDATDRVTLAALRQSLELLEEVRASGAEEAELNVLASPAQSLRQVFDLMPTDTAEQWAVIAARLTCLPEALAGYTASLRLAASRGDVSPVRQVRAVADQAAKHAAPHGFFAEFAARARTAQGGALPASVQRDLERAAVAAAKAYRRFGHFLTTELIAQAPQEDAVGSERYALLSRRHLGQRIDLAESYAWGQDELARIRSEMAAAAERIKPGASVREAMEHLDSDPARRLQRPEELREWMQERSDAAVAALADTHFDIPEPLRTLECCIAPTKTGGIYYTAPTDDFSRPGRMWWSVPESQTGFSTWRELSNVYHEGVPGHHLQHGQSVYRRDLLNRWRRLACWTPGHGEGWALYAERLMADLGYLDDPGDYLGMLDAQSLRAARVVLDIGIHCRFPAPDHLGGGDWTYEKAWEFLIANCSMDHAVLRFELDRYLGWAGQAPAYKIGERMWLQLRDEVTRVEGPAFELSAFHQRALDLGGVPLEVLRPAVLGEI